MTFKSGDKYDGSYKNDKRDGKGTYTWSEGSYYVGDWVEGYMTGTGKKVDSDGSQYEVTLNIVC